MPVVADIPLIFDQTFAPPDLLAVVVLVILEGVLSIDNALVLGLLAKRLPRAEQGRALWYGLGGAVLFRVLAVLFASILLRWTFAKFLGGAYLVYIAVKHLFFESHEAEDTKLELDEHGHPKLVDPETGGPASEEHEELEMRERQPVYIDSATRKRLGLASFWPTVLIIELTDIAFAVDSILAALAFVASSLPPGHPANAFHPKLWLVIFGGLIGVALMRVAASMFIRLLERFPRFETAAYLLVIVIGLKLLGDWGVNSDWSFDNSPWISKQLGGWKQTFEGWEEQRRRCIDDYKDWLEQNWLFPPSKWETPVTDEAEFAQKIERWEKALETETKNGANKDRIHEIGQGVQRLKELLAALKDETRDSAEKDKLRKEFGHVDEELNSDADPLHTPHLLNFHQLTRPESLIFWLSMVICFCIGFVPKRSKKEQRWPLGEHSE
jgi:YkoY family integral membrane protein